MASLKLRNSTWYAVWTQNGKQVVRTTNIKYKGPKEKKLAQNTASSMEAAAKGNISVSAAVDAIRKTAETIGLASSMPSIKEYLEDYTACGRDSNKSNYKRAVKRFMDFLGTGAIKRLDLLTTQQCRAFAEQELKRVAYTTVKHYRSTLCAALNNAVAEGIIDKNPMTLVQLHKLVPEGTKRATERLPFTIDELRVITTKFPYPWRQLALTSYLTGGQRLGDIVRLKWKSIDFEKKLIVIRTSKTGKVISAPIVPMLELTLKTLYQEGEEYVFPSAARQHMRSKGKLSVEFTTLLKAHGILSREKEATTGDRRPVSVKSFHSIRHTVVSEMRCNPAITADLSRDIVGHDSEAVERGYFKAPSKAKLDAFDFLCKQIAPARETGEGSMPMNKAN